MGVDVLIIEPSLTLDLPGRADRRHHRAPPVLVWLPLASWRGEGGETRRKPILYGLGGHGCFRTVRLLPPCKPRRTKQSPWPLAAALSNQSVHSSKLNRETVERIKDAE